MANPESGMISQGEVESLLQGDQQSKNHQNSTQLGRQSSIYSLTLDEFQHTLCDNGKNFGSMNMDELLTSIWTAEENQAAAIHPTNTDTDNRNGDNSAADLSVNEAEKRVVKLPSLPRQNSLTLPPPLCLKTVHEVWSEIHNVQDEEKGRFTVNRSKNVPNPESAPSQPTFGEMTLEDFLIKAGVVREQGTGLESAQQQQYEMYQNSPIFASNPILGGGAGVSTYQTMPQSNVAVGESSGYAGNVKRNGGYPPQTAACYGGRVGNGGGSGGGYGPPHPAVGLGAPVSPVSSDGICTSQFDNSGGKFGSEMEGHRGRKRIIDGPVEKVVERRQRRMIKNRESAARSRARKQAYTVELEAELNQLKEENAHLRQALNELERKRKQQYFEELKVKALTKAQKAKEKMRLLRKTLSCPL